MANHFQNNSAFGNFETLQQRLRNYKADTGKTFCTYQSIPKTNEVDPTGLRFKYVEYRCKMSK